MVDLQCRAKCPYHCNSWMIDIGGGNWTNGKPRGMGLQEDITLSFKVGKNMMNVTI